MKQGPCCEFRNLDPERHPRWGQGFIIQALAIVSVGFEELGARRGLGSGFAIERYELRFTTFRKTLRSGPADLSPQPMRFSPKP